MIRYDLHCAEGHDFDGWFKDSAAFDRQAAARLVECPSCGGTRVSKQLMAPAVVKAPGAKGRAERPAEAAPEPAKTATGPVPAQVIAVLQRMRAEIERNCDYVGPDFAEEARRMHSGASERRGIYGEASDSEADALREEGIEVARIPWVPRAEG